MRAGAAVVVGLAALVLPAQAAAHPRTATVALDYRLVLDHATQTIPGVHVRVLDGDRDFELRVDPGVSVVVRGELHEPFLRIDPNGVWANASSPTATCDRVVGTGKKGWIKVGSGDSIAWHDHRLSPPPGSRPGPVGRFLIPIEVDGRPAMIAGTFIRVPRPAVWPWLAAAAAIAAAIAAAVRHRPLRPGLTIGLGVAGGVAALTAVTTFAVRDAPTGGVAWLQIVAGICVAAVLGALLLRLRGRGRVHAAGVVGAVGAVVSLSSLSVFWHGVVISALSPNLARAACGLALVAGAAAAVLSFLPDFDEPLRPVRAARKPPR
jgi:hypothetical protein